MFNKHCIKNPDIYYTILLKDCILHGHPNICNTLVNMFNARTCWRHIFPRQFTVVVRQVPPSICGSAQRMFIY